MTSGIIDLKTVKRPSKRKDAQFIQSLSSISPERAMEIRRLRREMRLREWQERRFGLNKQA